MSKYQTSLGFNLQLLLSNIEGTASLAVRCDLGGLKLEKVHEFFQVCLNLCRRSCDNMWLVMARYEIKVGQILTDSLI